MLGTAEQEFRKEKKDKLNKWKKLRSIENRRRLQ